MRFFLPVSLFFVCVLISGCGKTTPPADQVARETKIGFDADQLKIGGESSQKLYLVESSPNHYEGYVRWASGATSNIAVTRQDNGETVWRIVP